MNVGLEKVNIDINVLHLKIKLLSRVRYMVPEHVKFDYAEV